MTAISMLGALILGATSLAKVALPYEKYTLPQNGLQILVSEDHSLPLVAVNVWYHAGPLNEAAGRTGFAHLFEHLMFQGSAHVGDDAHFKLLEARGASMINGTTSFDRTNYFETVPQNELELALWLESDRMGFLLEALDQKKLDNQRDVVKNERRQSYENAPYGPSQEKLVQTLFDPGHPYHGNVIGSMDDLSAASLQDVKEFYYQHYAPSNATLAIVGDVDPATVKALVHRYFGSLPSRPRPAPSAQRAATIAAERRAEVIEPVSAAQVSMAYLSPASFAPGDADADILAHILGGGKASRLYQSLVYDQRLAQSVVVYQQSLALQSMFVITATVAGKTTAAKLEKAIEKLLDQVRNTPPTKDEVARARNTLLTQMATSLQKFGGFGGKADTLNAYNQYTGDPGFLAQDIQRYQDVTPQSVQTIAQNILQTAKRAVVTTVPKT